MASRRGGKNEAGEPMILVFGTTLRPDSQPLAEVAARLALRLLVPLRLIHVCEDPRAPLVLGTDQEHLLGSVRADLTRQAELLESTTGATVRPHLAAGPVVNALASLSQFELATALVVGPTTRRIRNTAERLSRTSRVPVIVLREMERLAAWLRAERPLRILVASDLGRAAEAARRFAANLASAGPTEVEVACVASPEETHVRLGLTPEEHGGLSREAESAVLRELAETAPEGETHASFKVIAARGRADTHVVAHADQGGFDIIIVGQRGDSMVEQIWRGSVSRGVVRAAPVTVASVPIPVGEVDSSFRPVLSVVVGADFTDSDHRVLAHAIGHAAEGATVHIAYVLGAADLPSGLRHAREEAQYRLAKLEREVGAGGSVAIETHVLEGLPAEQLLALSERVGADLLVLGARRRSTIGRVLMGSLAHALMEDARIPILLIPARKP